MHSKKELFFKSSFYFIIEIEMDFKKTILIIIFSILALFFINKFFYSSLKDFVFSSFQSVENSFWEEGAFLEKNLGNFFRTKEIIKENEELKKENIFLKSKINEIKGLEEENLSLRKLLNLDISKETNLIEAEVISGKQEDTLLLNKGTEDGLRKGMPALSEENILIGRINQVFDNFSELTLISQKDFTFSVNLAAEEGEILEAAKGIGDSMLKIESLAEKGEIKEGDIVSSSAVGGIFPSGILVGKITEIERRKSKSLGEYRLEPYFKNIRIKKVFLIENFSPNEE